MMHWLYGIFLRVFQSFIQGTSSLLFAPFQEKRFVTEENLEDALKEITSDEGRSKETMPCSVSEFSADCVKAQFQVSMSIKR